jgi:hypothetical protein
MLEFIVLGIIPGTHVQITFSWVLLMTALGLIAYEFYIRRQTFNLSQRFRRLRPEDIAL